MLSLLQYVYFSIHSLNVVLPSYFFSFCDLFLANLIHVHCFHFQIAGHDFRCASNTTLFNWTHNHASKLQPFLAFPLLVSSPLAEFPVLVGDAAVNAECQAVQAFLTLPPPTPSICNLAHKSCKFYLCMAF